MQTTPALRGRPSSSSDSGARALVAGLVLACLATGARAADLPPHAEVHQLWVAHLLLAAVAGLLGFVLARWPALAGIGFFATVGYAIARIAGSAVPADVLRALGSNYPFHVEATGMLVPLAFVVGYLFWLTSFSPRARRA